MNADKSPAGKRLLLSLSCRHEGAGVCSVRYTILGVPPEVDRALRRKAAYRKQSLNQLIVHELTAATTGLRKQEDFGDLVGKWTPDPAFDEVIAAQRQIDSDSGSENREGVALEYVTTS